MDILEDKLVNCDAERVKTVGLDSTEALGVVLDTADAPNVELDVVLLDTAGVLNVELDVVFVDTAEVLIDLFVDKIRVAGFCILKKI